MSTHRDETTITTEKALRCAERINTLCPLVFFFQICFGVEVTTSTADLTSNEAQIQATPNDLPS